MLNNNTDINRLENSLSSNILKDQTYGHFTISMMEGSIQDTANELKILYRLIEISVNQFDLTEATRLLQRSMTPLHKKIDLGIITSLSITKGCNKLVDNEKPKISLSERLRDAQLR